MNSLTIPRARRPVKARVIAVGRDAGECGAMRRARARLGRAQKRGADLGRRRAGGEHGGHGRRRRRFRPAATSGSSVSRATSRSSGRSARSLESSQPAAMAARLGALDDERVRARRGGRRDLGRRTDGHPDRRSRRRADGRRASDDGQPKAVETTATRASARTAALRGELVVVEVRAAPSSTP